MCLTGDKHFYYRHPAKGRRDGCCLASLRAKSFEGIVLDRLSYLSERQDIIEAVTKTANENLSGETPKVMKLMGARKQEYARLSREMDDLIQKVRELDDVETIKEVIAPKIVELKDQRKRVKEEIGLLKKSLNELRGNVVSAIEPFAAWHSLHCCGGNSSSFVAERSIPIFGEADLTMDHTFFDT